MKELGRGKKRLQSLICPLEFQPQADEAFTADGRKHTHAHTHTHTHTHTQSGNGLNNWGSAKKTDDIAITVTIQGKTFDKRFTIPLDFDFLSILYLLMGLKKI